MKTKQGAPADDELLDAWADSFESGAWPEGVAVRRGRPRMSDEEPASVTVKMPRSQLAAIDARTKNRSSFIRQAVAACL